MQFIDLLATHSTLFIGVSVFVGLMVGSFLNVVIHRMPIMLEREFRAECAEIAALDARGEAGTPEVSAPDPEAEAAKQPPYNLVVPRSACPRCKAPITALQNVPVVSWLALGGKCANCRTPISARYPVIELVTGVLTGLTAWHFGFGLPAVGAIVFTWFLIALTMIDYDTKFLPDQLTYPLLWLGLLMSLSYPVWSPYAEPVTPRDSILGAVCGYLALWSVYWLFKLITHKEGMGYGDFKLLAALGAWLGWQMLLPIILLSSLAGSVIGIAILVRKKLGKDTEMPFGPYLAAAGWLALVFGHQLVSQYFTIADWFAAKL